MPGQAQVERACIDGLGLDLEFVSVEMRIENCTLLSERDGFAFAGHFNRARARMSAQDWHGAAADFTSALKVDPQSADAYFERGRVRFLYLAKSEEALDDFTTAYVLSPREPSYHMMLALAAIDLAKQSSGDHVLALVQTARSSLEHYLDLTKDTDDLAELAGRQAAEVVLSRISDTE